MERMSENKKYMMNEYGHMLLEIKDTNILRKLLEQTELILSRSFTVNEDVSQSTHKYFEDFVMEISYALVHNEFYVAFIKLNRLFYHYPSINIEKKWWELGDYSEFIWSPDGSVYEFT